MSSSNPRTLDLMILQAADDDWTDMSFANGEAKRFVNDGSNNHPSLVAAAVRRLLESGDVVFGQLRPLNEVPPGETPFVRDARAPAEIEAMLLREWPASRYPFPGELGYIVATEQGSRFVSLPENARDPLAD